MADKKILTQREMIPDAQGDNELKIVTVRYDRVRDEFYVTCPAHLLPESCGVTTEWEEGRGVKTTVHDGRIYADRPQAAMEAIQKLASAYRHAISKRRRVIAYNVRYDEDMHFEQDSMGVILKWAVGWELRTGSRVQLMNYEPPNRGVTVCNGGPILSDVREKDLKIMDWTDERERFFRNLTASLEALKERCKSFLGDEKRLALAIDTGTMQPLLEGPNATQKIEEDEKVPDEAHTVGTCSQKLHDLREEMKATQDPVTREHIQREINHWEERRHKSADAR